MRKFWIVFFTVFILTTNYFSTSLLKSDAEDRGGTKVVSTEGTKVVSNKGSKVVSTGGTNNKVPTIEGKNIKEISFRNKNVADEFYRFRAPELSKTITEIVNKVNQGEVIKGIEDEIVFTELIELVSKDNEKIIISGRLWVDDVFKVESKNNSYYLKSIALRDYFKAIMVTKIPSVSPDLVIIQKGGNKEEIVIGSLELEAIKKDLNEMIQPLLVAPKVDVAWNKEEWQGQLDDPTVDYYDVYLPFTLYYNGIEAERILVFKSGKYENMAIFTNKDLTKGSAGKVE